MQPPLTLDMADPLFHDDLKKVVAFLNITCLDDIEENMKDKDWLKRTTQSFLILHMESLRLIANLNEEVTKLRIKLEN